MESTGYRDIQVTDLETLLTSNHLPPEGVLVPFPADCRGEPVNVLAVLQRTAVIHSVWLRGDPQDRAVVRRSEVIVDQRALRVRPVEDSRSVWPARKGHAITGGRRCSRCRRPEGQVAFPLDRSWCCRSCHRELSREWRRRMRRMAA